MERKFDEQIKVFESQFQPYTKSLDKMKNYLDQMILLEESFAEESVGLNAIRMVQEHYNFAAFIAIAILDSAVVCKNLLLAEFTWERVYQLRAATLLVYETIGYYKGETKMDKLSDFEIQDLQVDTDFDSYEDPLHPDELTIKWRFQIFTDGEPLYSLEHFSRILISEVNDATLPDEQELEAILKVTHKSLKEDVESRTEKLPRFIRVEDFSTVDVFEHSQQIKQILANIGEKHNPAAWQ